MGENLLTEINFTLETGQVRSGQVRSLTGLLCGGQAVGESSFQLVDGCGVALKQKIL